MIHFNGNRLAAVDVETTGTRCGHHDIIQVCVLLLTNDCLPDPDVDPFYLLLKPKRPENVDKAAMTVSRLDFAKIMQQGIDPWDAAEMFDDWFVALQNDTPRRKAKLPINKKLLPLAQNWVFDRGFMIDWLGETTYDSFFHPWYRDPMAVAQYLNDSYACNPNCILPHKVPFPKSNLAYLCSQLKVINEKSHDALQDCIATAAVYRKMMYGQLP